MIGLDRKLRLVLLSIQHDVGNMIPDLNNGGCGVFAALILKELTRIGIKAEVISNTKKGGSAPLDIVDKVKTIKKGEKRCDVWDDYGLDRTHLAVRFKSGGLTYTYDSEALLLGSRKYGLHGHFKCNYAFGKGLNLKQASALARDKGGWNRAFDRAYVPLVRSIVRKYFCAL